MSTALKTKPGLLLTEEGLRRITEELKQDRSFHLPKWEKEVKQYRAYGLTKRDDLMAEAMQKRNFFKERISELEELIATAIMIPTRSDSGRCYHE